jgi:putative flippase GtrA
MQAGSELLIGLGVGVVAVVAHGLVEWVFVASATQYVLAGSLGLITGLRSRFLSQQKVTAKNRRNARPSEIVPPTRESLGMA